MANYYNEIEPFAAAWLRELVRAGCIAAGDVDERSIMDVRASDLKGYRQCHFFAGIGGWSYALRLAGWPDDRPVCTGSCPCQPFSSAGKRKGTADSRHLWPEFYRLIGECRPPVVFGEQVEAAIRLGWLDGVFADLERAGYACGSAVLPAAGIGAPHIRHRIWWVADADDARWNELWRRQKSRQSNGNLFTGPSSSERVGRLADAERVARRLPDEQRSEVHEIERGGAAGGVDNAKSAGTVPAQQQRQWDGTEQAGPDGGLGDADLAGSQGRGLPGGERGSERAVGQASSWSDFDLVYCRDGKARRVESGTFPLVTGVPKGLGQGSNNGEPDVDATAEARVMRLKGYGNSIVAQLAAEFILAYRETIHDGTV